MTNIQNTRTLVIGGAGFIGLHVSKSLLESGRKVTVLGRSPKPINFPPGMTYVQGDFGSLSQITSLLDKHHEVIHLAYASVPNSSYESPLKDLNNNLVPTIQLFSEMAQRKIRLVLVSSGGTVYGNSIFLPITENHSTNPISPYGVTKLALEKYANLYAITSDLDMVCVRPSNIYGVGQKPFMGQGFVATLLASALMDKPIKLYGGHEIIRDYLYVSDAASAIVAALESGHSSEIYNVGSGVGLENLKVVEYVKELVAGHGKQILIDQSPARPYDVKSNILDSNKLRRHTGWEPKVDFKIGLEKSYNWIKTWTLSEK